MQNQLYPCLQSKNHVANACEWTETCALKTFSETEGQAYSRRKEYFDPFSVAQVIIVRGLIFSFFYLIVLFSFCTQIFFFTRCELEDDNCRQWLQNNCFFARKQLLELDLTEASKTNPYVQFSVFSNGLVSLICWTKTLAWTSY